jgi:hypothetical protein
MEVSMSLKAQTLVPAMTLVFGLGCGGGGGSGPSGDTSTTDTASDLADTITPDTGVPDTGVPDTGVPDTGVPDTGGDTAVDPGEDGVVGDPCYNETDCMSVPGAGRMCLTSVAGVLSFPGGYCSAVCTSGADCGPGAECVELYGSDYCLKTCTSVSECRASEGYECTTLPGVTGGPYCVPPSPDPESTTDY